MLTDMNKNNKAYVRPAMRVVKLQQQSALLINTSQQSNAPRYDGFDDTGY